MLNKFPQIFLFLIFVLLFGCAHYQLGTSAKLPFESLHIENVENDSFAPQIQALMTKELTQSFIQDGGTHITSENKADATLIVKLTEFNKSVSATEQRDTVLAQSFYLTLIAECTLINNKTGEVYFKNTHLSTKVDAFVNESYLQSEYQAMPVLARNLAAKIRAQALDTWPTETQNTTPSNTE